MKGRREVKEGIFCQLRRAIQRVNGQDKRCAFERGVIVGARRTGFVKNCNTDAVLRTV